MLSLKRKDISGITITVHMTLDGVLVVYAKDNIFNRKINQTTYQELLKYNIGTRIRKCKILTLKEVLDLFDGSSKKIIIDLADYQDRNQKLVESLLDLVSNYSNTNIYIKSVVKENVLYLRDIVNYCKLGATISNTDSYFWNLDLDFYSICYSKVDSNLIMKQLENNKIIMFEDIKDGNMEILNRMINHTDNLYIITDSIGKFVTFSH